MKDIIKKNYYKYIVKRKIGSQSGETIAETLVSLLISALALVMLAGAISAASGIIERSRQSLNSYYTINEDANGVVKMQGAGVDGTVTIQDSTGQHYLVKNKKVACYENRELRKNTVMAYRGPIDE